MKNTTMHFSFLIYILRLKENVSDLFCQRESINGKNYIGYMNTTVSGRTCQAWNANTPHVPKFGMDLDHNYCRNPEGDDESKVWCYTSDPDKRWEYCEVPVCFEPPTKRKKRTSISESPKKNRASCVASASSSACNDCVREGCKVRRSPGCCLHPTCRRKRRKKCKWIQRYLGSLFSFKFNLI